MIATAIYPYWKEWQLPSDYRKPELSNHLAANYVASILFTRLRKDRAEAILPPDFSPDPGEEGSDGCYPLMVALGLQQYLGPAWCPTALCWTYLECIIGFPCARWKARTGPGGGPFWWMHRLYLNSSLATLLGQIVGYPKILSRLTTTESSYTVETLSSGQQLLRAEFVPCQNVVRSFESPECSILQELLRRPAVSRTVLGSLIFVEQQLDLSAALLQPVQARLVVSHSDVIPGLEPGSYDFAGIEKDTFGACRVRFPWSMKPPKLLSDYRRCATPCMTSP